MSTTPYTMLPSGPDLAVPLIPDAAHPLLTDTQASVSCGRRVATHRIKRAQLLAATRRRIASHGHRGVTLGMIAADCDTTVQTVFNLAGNKFELLKTAVYEHGSSLSMAANHGSQYPLLMLGFADAVWASAQRNPDYIKEAALLYDNMCRSSGEQVRLAGAALVKTALSDIVDDVRSTFTIEAIAKMLSTVIAVTMIEWAQDGIRPEQLRSELINRIAIVLMGVVRPKRGTQIENWLSCGRT